MIALDLGDNVTDRIYIENGYLIWDFGFITNLARNNQTIDDAINVTYTVRLLNYPDNNHVNGTLVKYDPKVHTDQGVQSSDRTHYLYIVEPQMEITSHAVPSDRLDAGDLVDYIYQLQHIESSTSFGYRFVWQIAIPLANLSLSSSVNTTWNLTSDSHPGVEILNSSSRASWFGADYDVIICKVDRIGVSEWVRINFIARVTQAAHANDRILTLSAVEFSSLPYDLQPLGGRRHDVDDALFVRDFLRF